MTYNDLVAAIAAIAVQPAPDSDLSAYLPRIIEQGELRCCRDAQFMALRVYSDATVVNGQSVIATPSDMISLRSLAAWPVGTTARQTLLRRDESYLLEYWPDRAATGVPKYFAEMGAGTFLVAPTPAATYTLELCYVQRPAGLSAGNPTTWLSLNAPDLLLYACLVALSGYLKNYGAASDDPRQALSWEQSYQSALRAVLDEEARRRGRTPNDTAPPAPPA